MDLAVPPAEEAETQIRESRVVHHEPQAVSAGKGCPHHGAVVLAEKVLGQLAGLLLLRGALSGTAPFSNRVAVPVTQIHFRPVAQAQGGFGGAPGFRREAQLGEGALRVFRRNLRTHFGKDLRQGWVVMEAADQNAAGLASLLGAGERCRLIQHPLRDEHRHIVGVHHSRGRTTAPEIVQSRLDEPHVGGFLHHFQIQSRALVARSVLGKGHHLEQVRVTRLELALLDEFG